MYLVNSVMYIYIIIYTYIYIYIFMNHISYRITPVLSTISTPCLITLLWSKHDDRVPPGFERGFPRVNWLIAVFFWVWLKTLKTMDDHHFGHGKIQTWSIQTVSGSDATLKWLEPFEKSCPLTFAQFVTKSFHRCAASPSFQRPGDPGGMLRDGDGPILEFHGDGEKLGSDTTLW